MSSNHQYAEEELFGMHIHRMGLKMKRGNRNLNRHGEVGNPYEVAIKVQSKMGRSTSNQRILVGNVALNNSNQRSPKRDTVKQASVLRQFGTVDHRAPVYATKLRNIKNSRQESYDRFGTIENTQNDDLLPVDYLKPPKINTNLRNKRSGELILQQVATLGALIAPSSEEPTNERNEF
jgi:hypothetical protein